MNMEKIQVASIGLSRTVRKKLIQDLSWVEQFKLLGINFDINLESMVKQNYAEIINKIEKLLRSYEKRKLSLIGKITVIKSMAIPKLVYAMSVLPKPKTDMVEQLEAMFKKFI